MSAKKVEFCLGNLAENGSQLVFDTLKEQYPQVRLERWGCLANCSECYKKPFVLIDETDLFAADSKEELLEKVLRFLATN